MQLQFVPPSKLTDGSVGTPVVVANESLDAWWRRTSEPLRTLQPNRIIYADLAPGTATAPKSTQTKSAPTSAPIAAAPSASPRYSVWILDASVANSSPSSPIKAVVFVLPQGRESEWQFRSVTGGTELAKQHGWNRIIFVGLQRGQVFSGGLEQVKQEISPLMKQLHSGAMQIVSIGSDVGARREVFRGQVSSSDSIVTNNAVGALVIEDVLVEEHVHRRLIFEGSCLIQSEARLNVSESYLTMTAAQRKAKLKKKKAAAKKKAGGASSSSSTTETKDDGDEGANEEEDEDTPATDAAKTVSTPSSIDPLSVPSSSASLICYNYLPCEYQLGLLTMLALLPQPLHRMILIGLGGGNFTMFLHFMKPKLELHVVELEQNVVESAHRFFGFYTQPPHLVCHVADGLTFINDLALTLSPDSTVDKLKQLHVSPSSSSSSTPSTSIAQLQDVIMLDVNNVDLGEGLSFPPPAFLEPDYFSHVKQCLTADGWLLLNLGCRNTPLRESLIQQISDSFTSVFILQPDEEYVNYIIAATNTEDLPPYEWTTTEGRLRALQVCESVAGRPPFKWDEEMVENCQDALKRVQRVVRTSTTAATSTTASAPTSSSFTLKHLF